MQAPIRMVLSLLAVTFTVPAFAASSRFSCNTNWRGLAVTSMEFDADIVSGSRLERLRQVFHGLGDDPFGSMFDTVDADLKFKASSPKYMDYNRFIFIRSTGYVQYLLLPKSLGSAAAGKTFTGFYRVEDARAGEVTAILNCSIK